jgi:membrane protein DedA with SNARE-associated domain
MHRTLEFLLHHGYVVLLGWVFAEQIGLPLPSMPLLLAAGALAGTGQLSFFVSLFYVVLAAVAADFIWYELGRRKGIRILQLLCKISLEPDSCVRRTEGVFSKQGARSLLVSKFIPGLGTVTAPLAGIFHMRPRRFLLFDAAGTLLWAGAFLGLGYVFSGQIDWVAGHLAALGGWLLVLLLGALAAYIAYKFVARQRFLRDLRISRITVDEL